MIVTIGVSWLTKLWMASVRFTFGTRSTMRSSIFSIFAMSVPQRLAGFRGEQVRTAQIEAHADPVADFQRLGIEHARDPVGAVELGEDQRLVAQRLGDADR